MAEQTQPKVRADSDVLEDVHAIIVKYPPTNADRKHIHVRVEAGQVVLSGHVHSPIHRRYLLDHVAQVAGVASVQVDALYDDETIRLEIGRVLPEGVIGNVHYGAVVLSGSLPVGETADAVAANVAALPGVSKVVAMI